MSTSAGLVADRSHNRFSESPYTAVWSYHFFYIVQHGYWGPMCFLVKLRCDELGGIPLTTGHSVLNHPAEHAWSHRAAPGLCDFIRTHKHQLFHA